MYKVNDKQYLNIEEAEAEAKKTGATIYQLSNVLGMWIVADEVKNEPVEEKPKEPAKKKTSPAQLKAVAKYDAAHKNDVRMVTMKLRRDTDADIIEALEKCDNISEFIKSAIRNTL